MSGFTKKLSLAAFDVQIWPRPRRCGAGSTSPEEESMVATMQQPGQHAQGEAQQHSEGPVARAIEQYTAEIPSDWYLWAAGASIVGSLSLMSTGNRHGALFVGQWAPTFLLLGLYNKIVKVAGSDRIHSEGGRQQSESRGQNAPQLGSSQNQQSGQAGRSQNQPQQRPQGATAGSR
jgi:hypothetical protein